MDEISTSNNKYKNYLIDKLLNEQNLQSNSTNNSNASPNKPSTIKLVNNLFSLPKFEVFEKENKLLTQQEMLTESKEDLHSETGTYTIEDTDEENPNVKLTNVLDSTLIDHSSPNNNINLLRQSTASTNVDLVSARAAIDETFGISKRPQINESTKNDESFGSNTKDLKNPDLTQKRNRSRARNMTYSLKNDLSANKANENTHESNLNILTKSIKPAINSSFSTSSSSSVSSSITASSSIDGVNATNVNNIIKKTSTYDIISDDTNKENANQLKNNSSNDENHEKNIVSSCPASQLNTSRTVGTDILMGDTEKLIEQLKKRRSDKKQELQTKYLENIKSTNANSNNNNETVLSCSSSNGSSTNLNMSSNNDPIIEKQKTQSNELAFSTRLSQSWTIPNDENATNKSSRFNENDSVSNRATVNTNPTTPTKSKYSDNNNNNDKNNQEEDEENDGIYSNNIKMNKYGNGGISFDYLLNPNDPNSHTNTSNYLNMKNLKLLNSSKSKPTLKSSMSAAPSTITNKSNLSGSTGTSTGTLLSSARTDDNNSQLTITKRFEGRAVGRRLSSSTNEEFSPLNSAKSAANTNTSLGAKIQAKAIENNSVEKAGLRRLKSSTDYSNNNTNNNANLSLPNSTSTNSPSQYTNRTLYLRQQTAKAKRDSLDNAKSANSSTISTARKSNDTTSHSNESSPKHQQNFSMNNSPSVKTNSILKKPASSTKSFANLNSSMTVSSSKSGYKSVSRTGSRNSSPYNSNHHYNNGNESLMTTSLYLPSSTSHQGNDAFHRRKNYDPIKAVEQEKLKRVQQQEQNQLSQIQSQLDGINNDNLEEDLTLTDSMGSTLQNLAASISNKQTYEKILQSTLQRLCIRLIQMSTGVLDKIGDNSSKLIDANSLFNSSIPNTELERMQQLAKLVNSMQLVNEHIQIIDSTLFSPKPEETYIKELTRIRQEVDSLKQTAALNNSASSSVTSIQSTTGKNYNNNNNNS